MDSKLRWLNRPGIIFQLKLWSNGLLIEFFDLNLLMESKSLQKKSVERVQFQSTSLKSFEKDQKNIYFILENCWIWVDLIKNDEISWKGDTFNRFWSFNWHLGQHFESFKQKLVEINQS